MKSHAFPPTTHTMPRAQGGVSLYAPCRNRTYNLMIKSRFGQIALARTGSAQPSPALIGYVALVPQTGPIAPRSSPRSHTDQFPSPLLSSSSPKNNGPVIKQENEEQFFQGKTEKNQKQSPQTRIQPTRGVASQ